MHRLYYLTAILVMLPVAANAQTRDVCFDQGRSNLTTEAYIAVREIEAQRDVPGALGGGIDIQASKSGPERMTGLRVEELMLEFIRLGIGPGYLRWQNDQPLDIGTDCIRLTLIANRPPALWHFWGPYFREASSDVDEIWARRMRFIVADYEPGRTVYRVAGHADTKWDSAANMALSQARADNVARELIRQGVLETDIEVSAFGETQLARATSDGSPEPLNRRAIVDVRYRRLPTAAPH